MPRWVQKWNEEEQKSEFIPIDAAARAVEGIAIHGDIESFVSPIDGTVITDRKQYREHMEKHGVVPSAEFSQEFYDRKAEERERHYRGVHSKEAKLARKREIYEIMQRAERNG